MAVLLLIATSLTELLAHIIVMAPMLLVIVTNVAFAKSALLACSLFSFSIMKPKLKWLNNLQILLVATQILLVATHLVAMVSALNPNLS